MLRVSARLSANTGRAPFHMNALAVETKVYEGTMISSPGCRSSSRALISSACVQLVVSRALAPPCSRDSAASASRVNDPFPEIEPSVIACSIYVRSLPWNEARLNGITRTPMHCVGATKHRQPAHRSLRRSGPGSRLAEARIDGDPLWRAQVTFIQIGLIQPRSRAHHGG